MTATLSLRPITREATDQVAHIRVAAAQVRFSGTVADAFETASDQAEFHAICLNDHPVGIFQIDRGYADCHHFARLNEPGLRAFMIDVDHQGMGMGTAVVRMLPGYLGTSPDAPKSLVLTVEMANPGAVRCYRAGGFVDTGEIVEDGAVGPQLVMRMLLN